MRASGLFVIVEVTSDLVPPYLPSSNLDRPESSRKCSRDGQRRLACSNMYACHLNFILQVTWLKLSLFCRGIQYHIMYFCPPHFLKNPNSPRSHPSCIQNRASCSVNIVVDRLLSASPSSSFGSLPNGCVSIEWCTLDYVLAPFSCMRSPLSWPHFWSRMEHLIQWYR